jgi:hypothetical protein
MHYQHMMPAMIELSAEEQKPLPVFDRRMNFSEAPV